MRIDNDWKGHEKSLEDEYMEKRESVIPSNNNINNKQLFSPLQTHVI